MPPLVTPNTNPKKVEFNGLPSPTGHVQSVAGTNVGPPPPVGQRAFGGQRAGAVACGNAHTLVVTVVREVLTGAGSTKNRTMVRVWY